MSSKTETKTFHDHGATEFRITVLAKDAQGQPKRVDFHIFEADDLLSRGSLKELFDKAPADGHKYECVVEDGKLKELKPDEAKASGGTGE